MNFINKTRESLQSLFVCSRRTRFSLRLFIVITGTQELLLARSQIKCVLMFTHVCAASAACRAACCVRVPLSCAVNVRKIPPHSDGLILFSHVHASSPLIFVSCTYLFIFLVLSLLALLFDLLSPSNTDFIFRLIQSGLARSLVCVL